MKIGETTRCCSFFLKTHVKISSKISIIEFNIQIKWCIIVTPSREAEKDYQGYFNSPPHKKNHIATTMINTVFFKISTHILTKRMTTNPTITFKAGTFQLTSSRRGWRNSTIFFPIDGNFNSHPHEEDDQMDIKELVRHVLFQLTSSRRGWLRHVKSLWRKMYFNSHPHEEDDEIGLQYLRFSLYFNSHPHEEDDGAF